MTKNEYKFIGDNGQVIYIKANSLKEAIKKVSIQTNIPMYYLEQHFRIKKVWKDETQ